jgi:hypothetical protein
MTAENGAHRLDVRAAEEYDRQRRGDRKAVLTSELTPEDIAEIAAAQYPPGFEHLDAELSSGSSEISDVAR